MTGAKGLESGDDRCSSQLNYVPANLNRNRWLKTFAADWKRCPGLVYAPLRRWRAGRVLTPVGLSELDTRVNLMSSMRSIFQILSNRDLTVRAKASKLNGFCKN